MISRFINENKRRFARALHYLFGKDDQQLSAIRLKKLNQKECLRAPGAGFMLKRLRYMSSGRDLNAPGRLLDDETSLKECPYCAEAVGMDAVKCRYCGAVLA